MVVNGFKATVDAMRKGALCTLRRVSSASMVWLWEAVIKHFILGAE